MFYTSPSPFHSVLCFVFFTCSSVARRIKVFIYRAKLWFTYKVYMREKVRKRTAPWCVIIMWESWEQEKWRRRIEKQGKYARLSRTLQTQTTVTTLDLSTLTTLGRQKRWTYSTNPEHHTFIYVPRGGGVTGVQPPCQLHIRFSNGMCSGGLREDRACSAPPPPSLGYGLTPSLTVMLANDRSTVKMVLEIFKMIATSHQWLSDSFRVHQIRFRQGLCPGSPCTGGAYGAPQTL